MSPSEETTCPKEIAESPPSLFQNGNIVFQTHHVGWVVSGSFAVIATITSVWLVNRHLQWYNNKREQRYIVRILFMVPIYATISFASYLFWNHSTPLLLIRDAYEAIVLTAFFYLLLMYISPDTEEQKKVFLKCGLSREADIIAERKGEKLSRWVFPMGFVKWKPGDGLYFLQLMKWGVLQYCVIRPLTTLAAVILDYAGLYCEESWGLEWGHVYITIIISLSVTIAMYCLIQLYVPISSHLAFHKPLLKLFAIKAVVFLTFWQATFLSVLSMFGVVKDTKYMTAEDINIGIGALLETFEMMLFAFLHIRAFTYKAYQPIQSSHSKLPLQQPTPRLRSLGHAMDFRETFREIWVGCMYMFDKMRGRQPTTDLGVLRTAHYETAFGRPRGLQLNQEKNSVTPSKKVRNGRATLPAVEVEVDEAVEYEVEGERQWLGVGNDYGYGIGYLQREKSEGLEVQIERELKKRGYNTHAYEAVTDQDRETAHHQGKRSSWWRTIYDRISTSDAENRQDLTTSHKLPKGKRGSHSRHQSHYSEVSRHPFQEWDHGYGHPLPVHQARTKAHHSRDSNYPVHNINNTDDDRLAPLSSYSSYLRSQQRRQNRDDRPNISPILSAVSNDAFDVTPALNSTAFLLPTNTRSDSLLGRIFPPSTENVSSLELGHLTDGTAFIQSHSLDSDDHPAKTTPRARLTPSTPQIVRAHYGIKETNQRQSVIQGRNHVHHPSTAQIVDPLVSSYSEDRLEPMHISSNSLTIPHPSPPSPVPKNTATNQTTSAPLREHAGLGLRYNPLPMKPPEIYARLRPVENNYQRHPADVWKPSISLVEDSSQMP